MIAGGAGLIASDPAVLTYVQAAHRHQKAIGAWGDGAEVLAAAGIAPDEPGMSVADGSARAVSGVLKGLGTHRAWDRAGCTRPGRPGPAPSPRSTAKKPKPRKRPTTKAAASTKQQPKSPAKKGVR